MPVFIALLRAVNVGGTGKLPMSDLRTPFCLSSGNLGGVDFSAALSDEREDLSGEITLQGSNGVEFGMPFRDPTSNIVLGSLIGS